MRVYNHGPIHRRPYWISFWLKEIRERRIAIFHVWIAFAASIIFSTMSYYFIEGRLPILILSAFYFISGIQLAVAIRWVDKYDHWDRDK